MARTMTAAVTIEVAKLSDVLGKMFYQEERITENPQTHVKTKKAIVLSKRLHDMYEVAVPDDMDLGTIKEDDVIEFDDVEVTFRANARNGFGGAATPWLTISAVAKSFHRVDGNTGKPIENKDNKVKS